MMRTLATGVAIGVSAQESLVLVQNYASLKENAQPMSVQGEVALEDEWTTGFGSTVPLTESGYKTVASLKDNQQMKAFIRRAVMKEARYVKNFGELNGIIPFYSGTQGVQNFEALQREIRSAAWVGEAEGRTAPLNDAGYQKVAKLKSKPNMIAYARRLLDADGRKCIDEGALQGLVSYFDGEISVQDFTHLRRELLASPWAVPRAGMSLLQEKAQPVATSEDNISSNISSNTSSNSSSNMSDEWNPLDALKKLLGAGEKAEAEENKTLVDEDLFPHKKKSGKPQAAVSQDAPPAVQPPPEEKRTFIPCCLGLKLQHEDDDEKDFVMGLNMETCRPYQNGGTNNSPAVWLVDIDRAGRMSLKSKQPQCGFLEVDEADDGSENIMAKTKDRLKDKSKWDITFVNSPQAPGDETKIALSMNDHYLSRNIIPKTENLALGFGFVHNAPHADLPYEAQFLVVPQICPEDEEVKYEKCFAASSDEAE